jgi:hypothetical protein
MGEASINTDQKNEELDSCSEHFKKEKRDQRIPYQVKPTSAYFGTLMAIK